MSQAALPAPWLPFETLEDDGPPFAPRLSRPLVWAFEHSVLPEALRINHPELLRALRPGPSAGPDFMHLWLKSALLCEDSGLWPPGLSDDEAFDDYLRPLAAALHCQPLHAGAHSAWILRTPPPRAAGETHFIALCRRPDDTTPFGQPSATARCYTLEAGAEPGLAFGCEWTPGGRHANRGPVAALTQAAFGAWVCEQLARAPG